MKNNFLLKNYKLRKHDQNTEEVNDVKKPNTNSN